MQARRIDKGCLYAATVIYLESGGCVKGCLFAATTTHQKVLVIAGEWTRIYKPRQPHKLEIASSTLVPATNFNPLALWRL